MNQIKCEHPVIIENPYLRSLVSKYQKVWMHDHWLNMAVYDKLVDRDVNEVRHDINNHEHIVTVTEKVFVGHVTRNRSVWSDWDNKYHQLFFKNRTGVTLETIDDYYIVTGDGEMIPVYLAVPCGKCALCREKKARDWQTRCLAETAMSDYPPLFITLTYRDSDLPEDGVNKVDVQKFLKRLRIRIERHLGVKCRLRYVLVAEYGKNTHRAHYHMLLWNMPFVSDSGKNSWLALHDFIQEAWSHGWIGLERCVDCSGKYCMKYLRKECVVPEGCAPTFLLSSRRGGIGRAFADSLTEHVRNNPHMSFINISNKFDGSVTRCAIPDYFKRIWFPSLSGIVCQEVRDEVAKFMELARMEGYVLDKLMRLNNLASWHLDPLLNMVNDVTERFSYCVENFEDCVPEKLHRTDINAAMYDVLNSGWERDHKAFLEGDWYSSLHESLKASYTTLCTYHIDKERVQQLLDLHVYHSSLMRQMAEKIEPVVIADEVARIQRENLRLERGVRPDECLHETD